MINARLIMVFTFIVGAFSQRSPYAGRSPIGYASIEIPTTTTTATPLGNRLGSTQTTEKLPIEALGDRELVNRVSKWPEAQQPFWFLNRAALEDFRQSSQTYEQRENSFLADAARTSQLNQARGQNVVF